jgi:8-amino-7-oxononanoate synthase
LSYTTDLQQKLNQRNTNGLLRKLRICTPLKSAWVEMDGRRLLNLISNDYLGFSSEVSLIEAAAAAMYKYGTGSGGSRLICGNHPLYQQAEERLSRFLGGLKCLIFASGYQTNLGTISALIDPIDAIFMDRLAHASMIDGAILSRGKLYRFRHNDMNHLESLLKKYRHLHQKALIVTESLFSMDGDQAPLKNLVELKERYDAFLLVDEAHAVGVLGPKGKGLVFQANLQDRVDIIMGTFSKALGCVGGFIAGSELLVNYLINTSGALIYSTALPPGDMAAINEAISLTESAEDRRAHLRTLQVSLRSVLKNKGLDTGNSYHHILPVFGYNTQTTAKWAQLLTEESIAAVAIRPPTVPVNTARLRLTVNWHLSQEDVRTAAEKITCTAKEVGLIC